MRWQDGRIVDVGTLGGASTEVAETPKAINAAGSIVGLSAAAPADTANRPFIWDGARMTALGAVPGVSVVGVNDQALVVLASNAPDGSETGYVWWRGVLTRLPSLGGAVTRPADVNNQGTVAGIATTANGQTHAVLWTVQPG